MGKLLRWCLFGLLGLLGLLVIAVVLVLLLFDANAYRDRISQAVHEQTGLTLVLEGDVSLSFFPSIGVNLAQARIANPEGFGPDPMAAIDTLSVQARLLPLLTGNVEVGGITLDGAELNLLVDANGRANWEVVQAMIAERSESAEAGTEAPGSEPSETDMSALSRLSIGGVALTNSTVRFDDRQAGESWVLGPVSLRLGGIQLGQPIDTELSLALSNAENDGLTLELVFQSQINEALEQVGLRDLALEVRGQGVAAALRGSAELASLDLDLEAGRLAMSPLMLSLNQMQLRLEANGEQLLSEQPRLNFQAQADTFNARELLADALGEAPAFRHPEALTALGFAMKGQWSGNQAGLTLEQFQLDESQLSGDLQVRPGTPLWLRGNLALDGIDLDRYQVAGDDTAPVGEPLDPDAPLPLPMDVLRSLDADVAVKAGRLQVAGLRLTDLSTRLRASEGVLTLAPIAAAIYQGRFDGEVVVDARGETAQLRLRSNLQGVQAEPLMTDLSGSGWLTGQGSFSMNADTELSSLRAMRQALTGGLSLQFAEGAVLGMSLEQAITEAVSRFNPAGGEQQQVKGEGDVALADKQAPRTDFSVLGVSMSIQQGIFSANNLTMQSDWLDLGGDGQFSLADGSIDLRLRPVFKQLPENINPRVRELLIGTPIPVRVSGPLTQPQYAFDLADALIQGQVNRARDEVRNRAESALMDLLRGRDEKEEEGEGGG
jgi:AsmA protein